MNSAGTYSLRPKAEDVSSHTNKTENLGVPNTMLDGFGTVKDNLVSAHPLELTEKEWQNNREKLDFTMLRKEAGLHMPLKLHMERATARKMQRLPCLPSSNLMEEVLTGRLDDIGFEDFLNNPADCEQIGQPHAMMERKDGLV